MRPSSNDIHSTAYIYIFEAGEAYGFSRQCPSKSKCNITQVSRVSSIGKMCIHFLVSEKGHGFEPHEITGIQITTHTPQLLLALFHIHKHQEHRASHKSQGLAQLVRRAYIFLVQDSLHFFTYQKLKGRLRLHHTSLKG